MGARSGWMMGTFKSRPSSAIFACTSDSFPKRVMSATLRRARMSAALRMRSSAPSGRTICIFWDAARSIRLYSNIFGVILVLRRFTSRREISWVSTPVSKCPMAVLILRASSDSIVPCKRVRR